MAEGPLHVVFGAGNVGRTLAAHLSEQGLAVRMVSRTQPVAVPEGVVWRAADAGDTEAAAEAATGAAVIYQCLNAPYSKWSTLFPPLQRGVLAAAERQEALLVSLENLYGYGPTGGAPMTEDLPLLASTVKGRTRAAMTGELLEARDAGRVHIAIGRASDFFGAGVTDGSTLGERVFGNAVSGRKADFIGDPELLHTYSYVPDIARGLATLGTDERAIDQVWHLAGPETVTTRHILELTGERVGHPVDSRSVSKLVLRALGVFNPVLRSMVEMTYQFDQPFVLDTSRYTAMFGDSGTPLPEAIADTVAWFQSRAGGPTELHHVRTPTQMPRGQEGNVQ
ncbi:MAG: NAD-dependent epimerase/dehydratase family protein [Acidimicrobiales bacterium]|jgi:nucleoside-diphosphate-sugar epimerase